MVATGDEVSLTRSCKLDCLARLLIHASEGHNELVDARKGNPKRISR